MMGKGCGGELTGSGEMEICKAKKQEGLGRYRFQED